MKQGWEIKKLGEVCTKLTDGSHNPPKGIQHSDYIMLSSQNVYNDRLVLDDVRFLLEEDFLREDKRTCVRKGDVLLTIVGTIGRSAVFKQSINVTLQRSVAVLRPHTSVLSRFLMYCLIGKNTSLNEEAHGIAQKGIYLKQLAQVPIPVPPLPEQEKIVSELDCLSGIIEKKRQQLKELDALAQSIFYEMFGDPIENDKGWEVKALKESVVEMFLGPFGSALKTDCYVNEEDSFCMVYEQKHAIRKTMGVENHYINREKFESLKRFEVHSGDFIMSCRGTIGEIFRLPDDAPIGIIHPSLMKIRIKEDVYNPTFFIRLLTCIVKNENTNGNCVQMAITAKELGARQPIVPPLPLQQSFAQKIEAIEKQKELIKKSIGEVETLFNARMQEYFG